MPFIPDFRSARYALGLAWATGVIGVILLGLGWILDGTEAIAGAMFCILCVGWIWNYRRRAKREMTDRQDH